MQKRKYLIGALLSLCGTLAFGGTAAATVGGQTLTSTMSPLKYDRKAFAPVKAYRSVLDTSYIGPGFQPVVSQQVLTFSKDVRFTPGNIPDCDLSVIRTVPEAWADAVCGASRVGGGTFLVNDGVSGVKGTLAMYNGRPSGGFPTIGIHADVFTRGIYATSTTLTAILNTKANTLSFAFPPTGASTTDWDNGFSKRKSGKGTFYVMARCRKKWVTSETTTFSNGQTMTASSTVNCKQKRKK